jgi:signal recognition particle receptor subunit beta
MHAIHQKRNLMIFLSKHPLVEYEFEEIRTAIALDREAAQVGWLTLFKTPGNRRRMRVMIAIAFFSQWSGNNLMYDYLYFPSGH